MNPRSINYAIELEKFLSRLGDRKPRLLLHSCCAPCSSVCLERLTQYFDITLFYYNPNLFPAEEYARRVAEQRRLIAALPHANAMDFVEGSYDPDLFYQVVRGLENEKEGGKRCKVCFELRLRAAARAAKSIHADYFTTTLSISPHKNAVWLGELGEAFAAEYGVRWLPSDFKKKNGFKRSTELAARYGLYRQDYCGCVFSRREAEARAARKSAQNKHGA